jgi:hypothetical protein
VALDIETPHETLPVSVRQVDRVGVIDREVVSTAIRIRDQQ